MPRHVLVVDDSALIRQVVQLGLSGRGWRVTPAGSGAEGLELAEREPPDVILLDVVMPDLDGPATLSALRAAERTRDVPVVFLTGTAEEDDVRRLRKLGAAGVIGKPFAPAALPDLLASAVGWAA
jgi:two-component system alkaline phosphatase synthesis response regulator PhoP